ncbi:hypothetical protein [Rhizobium sp. BK251]|uniref:hypothetical protein n=1 Tax=Rhizobium sp. BK251 TaxID=2512125 RepID=UPI001404E79D|nr:hypothetical protein [Rhizobium sp. BK251]
MLTTAVPFHVDVARPAAIEPARATRNHHADTFAETNMPTMPGLHQGQQILPCDRAPP